MARFRLAHASDAARVTDLVNRAYSRYIPIIGYEPMPMTCDYNVLTTEERVHLLVDDGDDDALLGLIVLYDEEDHIYIDNIAVEPTLQHSGYGRQMLDYALQTARDLGKPRVTLLTNAKMIYNIAFYTRYGFYETHRTEGKIPGSQVVHMAYDL
jgi:ribosomal protein S18 acetylase RimI-like enzyme